METYSILTGRAWVGLDDSDHLKLSLLYYVFLIPNGDTRLIRVCRIFYVFGQYITTGANLSTEY